MATNMRLRRVADLIRAEISDMILKDLKDPRIGFTSITRVRVSADLRHARVYVSVLGDAAKVKSAMAGLKSASGYIRRELGSRVRLRNVPELKFFHDETIEYAAHMEEIFNKLHETESSRDVSDEDQDNYAG